MNTLRPTIFWTFLSILICMVMVDSAWGIPKASYYMVSPPSCMPADGNAEDKLRLVNGAWTFQPGETGTGELVCPINFSGNAGNWDMFQLWYRDQFNEIGSNDGFVRAHLMKRLRKEPGAEEIEVLESSNGSEDEYGFEFLTNPPNGPFDFEMYFLRVVLQRANNTTGNVAFTGFEIRF